MLNSSGEVVGITTQKQFVSGDGRPLQGIGFALSSQDLLSVLRRFYPNIAAQHQQLSISAPHTGIGAVVVSSDADGADIFVDDTFVGNTPSTLTLPAGPHKVRVEAPSRVAWSREIELLRDSSVNLKATLSAAPPTSSPILVATVAPTSAAPSSTIASSQASLAVQPVSNPLPGSHTMTAARSADSPALLNSPSSKLASSDVAASAPKADETKAIWEIREVSLPATATPKVSINSFPSGADVFIDSAGVGHTPCTVEFPAGDHSLQVVLNGYKDQTRKISLNTGHELVVDVNMQSK